MDCSHSRKHLKGGSDDDGNVNADNIPENLIEVVQNLKEIVNRSEQEIYAMLVECNMDADEAANRLLSQETSNVAGSSTASCILGPRPSLNSDVSNVETKGVTIISGAAVPSLSVPSSRYQSARGCGTSGKGRTMADVVKMGLGSLKESVTEAPVKDNSLLPEKPVVSNLFSNSFTEPHSQTKDLLAPVNIDTAATKELQQLRFGCFRGMDGPGETSGLPSRFLDDDSEGISDCADRLTLSNLNIIRFLNDDSEDLSACADYLTLSNLNIRDGECHEEEQQRLRRNVGNEQQMNQHYSQPDVPSGHYGTIMSHPYSLQTQYNTYWPPSPYQQLGGNYNNNVYDLGSMVAPLPQYINCDLWHPHRSISAYGSGMSSYNAANSRRGYDNVLNSPFRNHLASHQHLVNPSHLSLEVGPVQPQYGNSPNAWPPPQGHNDSGRNYYSLLPGHQNQQSPSFRHEQQQHQPYRGTSYENERSSHYYASLDQQNIRREPSNVWTPPQGHNDSGMNYYSLFPGHQNQQSPSFRHEQQQHQPYRGTSYENERSSRYYASLDQQNIRRDPSNPTQQRPRPRNNY